MQLFRFLISRALAHYVNLFFRTNPHIKLIAVVGSVGKTSTKSTIVNILSTSKKVRTNRGNYNSEFSAPLEMLGVDSPDNPRSVLSWLRVLRNVRRAARSLHDISVVVQEFGIDHPGEMVRFGRYARPDITIVTAISPEHMEFFGDLETVAREEFALGQFSKMVVYNKDDIDPRFVEFADCERLISYGTKPGADYQIVPENFKSGRGFCCKIVNRGQSSRQFVLPVLGEHQLRIAAGASAVALELGLDIESVVTTLEQFTPVAGRMQLLEGQNGATIIDDTYNSSPLATASALKTLYQLPAKTKIAVLGDMNELGDASDDEHRIVGELCDPKQIGHLITVGENARKFMAPAAKKRGCTVTSFAKATEAVELLKTLAKKDTMLLFKGSQGGIYLEEAIKPLLKNPDDVKKLVRQSKDWLKIKQRFFNK